MTWTTDLRLLVGRTAGEIRSLGARLDDHIDDDAVLYRYGDGLVWVAGLDPVRG